jgi:oxygen-dependent protoporphyrinogen oxidase
VTVTSAPIVVVGAGLAGLAAAHELRSAGASVLLADAARRAGGVVVTEHPALGWVVEGGPDGFLGADADIPQLAVELGIASRLVDQRARTSLVWDAHTLAPVAPGAAAELLAIDARDLDLSAGFRSFAHGMAELTDALAAATPPQFAGVTAIVPSTRGLRLSATGGMSLECRAVVLAVPAYTAATLVSALDATTQGTLTAIPYFESANVSLAYRRDRIRHPLDAAGFATAPAVPGVVRACTFASSKFPGRAPDGHVLLRAFVTGAGGDPARAAHDALAPILGIEATPLWTRAFAWPRGIPRYRPGHREHVARARGRLARVGPIALAGAGYDGAGVSACVRSGRLAARSVLARL